MNIYVITPCFKPNPVWLELCCNSVAKQTAGAITHLIVNDGGPAIDRPASFAGEIIVCERRYDDYGDTPRYIGIKEAIGRGADVIALLDDDNWLEPSHIEDAVKKRQTAGAAFTASRRNLVRKDGSKLGRCSLSGANSDFADTSAVVYFPPVFSILDRWGAMEDWEHAIADRIVWNALLESGQPYALTGNATLNYRCTHQAIYEQLGLEPPEGVKERWAHLVRQIGGLAKVDRVGFYAASCSVISAVA